MFRVYPLKFALKIKRYFKKLLLNPRLKINKVDLSLKSLGSIYGGWVFCESEKLNLSTIVSCGLGEDASFDVEIASRYSLEVLIVDPTPRAVLHFEQIEARLGQPKISEYGKEGCQSTDSYDLTNLTASSLKLIPKAIWEINGRVPFYEPREEAHVSHSIVNFQNNYASNTRHIQTEAITLKFLLESLSVDSIPLIKLDIEGAEIEVIHNFLNDKIFPDQILVEYDELHEPSLQSRRRVISCHKLLLNKGYLLVNYSKPNNFLYLSKTAFGL